MSEVKPPENQSDLSTDSAAANDPVWDESQAMNTDSPSEAIDDSSTEEWETVDFPNVINVSELEAAAPAGPSQEQMDQLAAIATELHQQNQTLLEQNSDLLSLVSQLEKAVEDCQGALQAQIERSHLQEEIATRQNQEIEDTRAKMGRLLQELEASHQAAQRQQILVETLSTQLETSQERIAQLERECALIQERYNEQVHLVMHTEDTCRDLRSRLHRQQRYTLQYKAALEKCLDVPSPSHETQATSRRQQTPWGTANPIPKTQPVQPWSSEPSFPVVSHFDSYTSPAPIVSSPSASEGMSPISQDKQSDPESDFLVSTPTSPEVATADFEFPEASTVETQTLAEGDRFIELDAFPLEATAGSQAIDAEEVLWQVLATLENTESNQVLSSGSHPTSSSRPSNPQPSKTLVTTPSDPSKQFSSPNWPAPIVYPLRPPKHLPSLAAIDLPSFPKPSH